MRSWLHAGGQTDLLALASNEPRPIRVPVGLSPFWRFRPDATHSGVPLSTVTFGVEFSLVTGEIPLRLMSYEEAKSEYQVSTAYLSDPTTGPGGRMVRYVITAIDGDGYDDGARHVGFRIQPLD
jgi:hypothetical protein